MKYTTALSGLLLMGLGLPVLVLAELKVGYIDVTRVAEESPQYKAARQALQEELEKREGELRKMAEQLKAREDKLQRNSSVMSDEEVKKLERDIIALRRKLQNSRDEYRDELSLRQNEERTRLLRQVAEVVKTIGKENSFDLILTEGVAYASKDVDISDLILSKLKQNFKAR